VWLKVKLAKCMSYTKDASQTYAVAHPRVVSKILTAVPLAPILPTPAQCFDKLASSFNLPYLSRQ